MEYDSADRELEGKRTDRGVVVTDGERRLCVIDPRAVVLPCPECDSIDNDVTTERCRNCGAELRTDGA